MAAQHIAYGLVRDIVAEISQCPDNAIIAPTQIFLGHADNELLHFRIDSRPAGLRRALVSKQLRVDRRCTELGSWVGQSGNDNEFC
jgi:hypothetical protein